MADHCISLTFGSRATDGEDVAGLLRQHLPDADIKALFDADGALVGYSLDLHFESSDSAAAAALDLAAFLAQNGFAYEVGDPHA